MTLVVLLWVFIIFWCSGLQMANKGSCSVKCVDGLVLDVDRFGSGPTMIIMHGWANSNMHWQPTLDRLKVNFNCVFWNARMHSTNKNISISQMAADLRMVIGELELSNIIMVAHSMSVAVCLEYISIYGQDDFSKLVLIDQSPKIITDESWGLGLYGDYSKDSNNTFLLNLKNDFVNTAMKLGLSDRSWTDEQICFLKGTEIYKARRAAVQQLNVDSWIAIWKDFADKDYRNMLNKITTPTFLAYGQLCMYYGEKVAEYMNDVIPESKLKLYASAHYPQIDCINEFIEDVVNFSFNS